MNSRHSRRVLAALGVGVALTMAAGAASFGAQNAPRGLPSNPPQGEAPAPDRDQGSQQDRQLDRRDGGQVDRRGDRLERRLNFLHQRLRVTAGQERVWDDFANVIRNEAQVARDRFQDRRDEFRGRRDNAPPSAVERLERREQALAVQSARIDHMLSALRPLYAALNADQKRTADRLFFRPGAEQGEFFNRRVPGPNADGRFGRGFGGVPPDFDRRY